MAISLSWKELHELRNNGLQLADLEVMAYLDEHGFTEPGWIEKACDISIRSLYRVFNRLKQAKVKLPSKPRQRPVLPHVADNMLTGDKSKRSADTAGKTASLQFQDDPLWQALLDQGVYDGCANNVLRLVAAGTLSRQDLEEQLRIHAWRCQEDDKYREKSQSAFHFEIGRPQYLYKACLNNWPAPEEFYVERQKEPALEEVSTTRGNFDEVVDEPAVMKDNRETPTERLPEELVEAIQADLLSGIQSNSEPAPELDSPLPPPIPVKKEPTREEKLQSVLATLRFFRAHASKCNQDWRSHVAVRNTLSINGFTLEEVLPYLEE